MLVKMYGADEYRIARLAVDNAKERAGKGWELFGSVLRDALVNDAVVDLLLTQRGAAMQAPVSEWQRIARCAWSIVNAGKDGEVQP